MRSLLSLLCLSLLLTGCQPNSAEKLMRDYIQRLSNALEEPIAFQPQEASPYPSLPARRDRLHSLQEVREGLVDLLDLRHCSGLLPLIAERNSSLGRVMQPAQQLSYELELLRQLHNCQTQLREGLATAPEWSSALERVERIQQIKQQQLDKQIWNSLYASPEMEQQFSRASPARALDSQGQMADMERYLVSLIQVAQLTSRPLPDWPQEESFYQLSPLYEGLHRNRFGSEWLKSIQLLTYTLNQASTGIEARLERRPICFNQQANPRAQILRNVFQNYYATGVQPYLSQTHRDGERWLSLQQQLLELLPLPEAMQTYQQQVLDRHAEEGVWQTYIRARDRHTQTWQRLLTECGLAPGAQDPTG